MNLIKNIGYVILTSLFLNTYAQQTSDVNTNTFKIEEANISFDAPQGWTFVSKTGEIEQGKVQYTYTHDHVKGEGRLINPAIIVPLDLARWFKNEENYLEEKLSYHQSLDDSIFRTISPGKTENPLRISAHYSEGISGLENDPYGQQLRMITYWNETVGFHMVIQTSLKDLEACEMQYLQLLKSIRQE